MLQNPTKGSDIKKLPDNYLKATSKSMGPQEV